MIGIIKMTNKKDFDLDGIVVRAGKKDYKKVLQKRLENLLRGIGLMEVARFEMQELRIEIKKQKNKSYDTNIS